MKLRCESLAASAGERLCAMFLFLPLLLRRMLMQRPVVTAAVLVVVSVVRTSYPRCCCCCVTATTGLARAISYTASNNCLRLCGASIVAVVVVVAPLHTSSSSQSLRTKRALTRLAQSLRILSSRCEFSSARAEPMCAELNSRSHCALATKLSSRRTQATCVQAPS